MFALAALTGPLPKAGVILAALLAAGTLLAGGRGQTRIRAAAMLGALVLAPVLLLADIWDTPHLRIVHRHPLPTLLAAIVAIAVLFAVSVWLRERPAAFGFLAVLALPFRVPISIGGTTANLLVPLYAVIAAGTLGFVVPALRGRGEAPPPHYRSRREAAAAAATAPPREVRIEPRLVTWVSRLLALVVVLYAIQAVYSSDFPQALQNIAFFYVPFALLFELLRRVPWTPRLLGACLALLAGLAVVFSLVGFIEYAAKRILLNPKLVVTNDLHAYFTVNSLFYDPDIFGRFLALVMILLACTLLFARRVRDTVATVTVLAVSWACLIITFSRSSLGALLVGLAALATLRWRATRALYLAAAVVALLAVAVAVTPTTFGFNQGFNGVTSGRGGLLAGGVRLFLHRPIQGYGSGAFATEYRAHNRGTATSLSASHTIPVTIAAEQGLIGLLPYAALLLASFGMLFRDARGDPARMALAAAYLALVMHTMLYADYLEDPATWALLGVGAALAPVSHRRRPATASVGAQSAVV